MDNEPINAEQLKEYLESLPEDQKVVEIIKLQLSLYIKLHKFESVGREKRPLRPSSPDPAAFDKHISTDVE